MARRRSCERADGTVPLGLAPALQQSMVLRHLPLALHVARELAHTYTNAHRLGEDVYGIARLALVTAAHAYDASHGTRFSTYASRVIQNTIHRASQTETTCILLPAWIATAREEDLPEKYRVCVLLAKRVASFPHDPKGNRAEWHPAAPEASDDPSLERLRALEAALRHLHPRSREVLHLRFWERQTLRQIGEHLGIGRERVRQIELKALAKLRGLLGEVV